MTREDVCDKISFVAKEATLTGKAKSQREGKKPLTKKWECDNIKLHCERETGSSKGGCENAELKKERKKCLTKRNAYDIITKHFERGKPRTEHKTDSTLTNKQ